MHLEETLRLALDEKEDIIKALQTQVQQLHSVLVHSSESSYSLLLLIIFWKIVV